MAKFTSRKFLTTLITHIVAILILIFPDHHDQINDYAQYLGPLILMTLTQFGYVTAQGKVDAAEVKNNAFK